MDRNHHKAKPKEAVTMDSIPGSLENIAKFSCEKSSDGSILSSLNTMTNHQRVIPTGAMENLTPELTAEEYQDYNLNIPVDEYETDSDLNSEECWGSDDEDHADGEIGQSDGKPRRLNTKLPPSQTAGQLVLVKTDNVIEVDSEEERDIMKEIRAEIQNQVREDLKDEIDVYQKKLQYLEREAEGTRGDELDEENASKQEMDPKLKAAILKMRKLDRILSKKMKREKEVKRERFLLQKRLREELEQIKPEGRDDSREVKANMEKFLMLAPPPSHNEGIDVEDVRSHSPVTPVFHTQLREDEFEERTRGKNKTSDRSEDPSVQSSAGSMRSGNSQANEDDDEKLLNKKKKRSKNFIKRNKQLAGDADNAIPMTDDEKKRISDLLGDLDDIVDVPEAELDLSQNSAWMSENPFQIRLQSGEGYLPEPEDKSTLQRIDSQLRTLLPEEEFTSLCMSQYTPDRQRLVLTRATVMSGSEAEFERLGEKALQEKRDERDLQTRLRCIEEELIRLKHPNEDMEIDTPCLTDDTLQDLIDQCVRSLSRTTLSTARDGEITPQSEYSSPGHYLMENPPRLEQDVLQRLLFEARESMVSSRATTDRDSINDVRNHRFTKELGIEAISRETWDVILSHDVSDSDRETPVPGAEQSRQQDRLSEISEEDTVRYSRLTNNQDRQYNDLRQEDHTVYASSEENLQKMRTGTPLSIHSYRESDIYDDNSRASSGRLSRTPFLPEISQSPCLVSQGASGHVTRSYDTTAQSDRGVASWSHVTASHDHSNSSFPRPPTTGKPENSQTSRSRSFTSPTDNS